ncbi:MAG: hypothetical protein GTO51_11115 [Candidatus Latescibacteria bacterium]|nr:hypothetical protein [Candidatus Latescibacterota bacterium]NIM66513.1 hypothetical protein [Candidatus Latescibacterota bacterium]NIO02993.1 hypothetical protein [Candidatus Latescibacterota bacterium]NIO30128.1 hypothetical protein [Candidatus Latescibacterota bacterium]NIO57747.1 hypothetical protein [Candidatus Latescibacterota bacterium]
MNNEVESGGVGGFFSRFSWIFYSPSRVFEDIERGAVGWWQPYIWLGVINLIVAYISIPVQRAIMLLNPRNLPEETLEQGIESFERFATFGIVVAPIAVLVTALITALIGYVLVSILATNANFKRFFTIYLYSSIVANVGYLLSVLIVVYVKGIETIRTTQDAAFSFGLGFLAPPENKFLGACFRSLDLFAIWALVIVGMGLVQVFKMTRNQAIWCVVPLWLISVVMIALGRALGGA